MPRANCISIPDTEPLEQAGVCPLASKETPLRTSLKGNIFYLFLLQGLNYALPLTTLPFLVRVLGTRQFGLLAFAFSAMQYLTVLTDYGFNLGATRRIAMFSNDRSKVQGIVSAVMVLKFLLLCLAAGLLSLFLSAMPQYRAEISIFAMAFLIVVGSVVFPQWLFQGLQDMKAVALISASGKVVCTIPIFMMVRGEHDLAIAAFWQSAGSLLSGFLAWIVVFKKYKYRLSLPNWQDLARELSDGFYVFVATAMSTGLANSSVFILGFLQPMSVVGTYAALERIAKAIVYLFAPVTQALYPRASEMFGAGYAAGKSFLKKTAAPILAAAIGVSVALALTASPLVGLAYGHELSKHALVLQILSAWLFLGVLNNVLGVQYLVASGHSKEYSFAFTLATIVTVLSLLVFTSHSPFAGAPAAMVIGELILTLLIAILITQKERVIQ